MPPTAQVTNGILESYTLLRDDYKKMIDNMIFQLLDIQEKLK